ncbi:PLP-dependent aminotransferase family protein [Microtetraspora malaysiensis]|uniref:aminotransferase-like domain-containing protein n=1 Tax=Microtetraspora malaysiensis TaxID=161358 RepID=UPI000832B740|nr:PLP-dependent aminotransferase family protein [Microtetraspora malaysiensis]
MAVSDGERGPRRLGTGEFVARIGKWHTSSKELHAALADAIRSAIECGDLRANCILPPQRDLARTLAVSRSTIVAAFETLRREGLLQTRQGSATWVCDTRAATGQTWLGVLGMMPVFQHPEGTGEAVINLAAAGVGIDTSLWEGRLPRVLEAAVRCEAAHGYFPAGLPDLRIALAGHLTARGLATEPEQILVTGGAQQAIHLVAAAWLQSGDVVLVEQPVYAGALEVFRAVGARVIGIPPDGSGPCADALSALAERHRAKLLFLAPTCSNPTGHTLSAARRQEIVRAARKCGLLIVEDAAQQDLAFGSVEEGYLAGQCSEHEVIVIGSLSKLFWGGLRVGWVRGEVSAMRNLSRLKSANDLGTSVIGQFLSLELLARHHEARVRRHAQLSALRDLAVELITSLIPEWQPSPCSGGLALWVRLPGADAVDFAQMALRHGVTVIAGPMFDVGEDAFRDHIRVSFATEPAKLRTGIERLATAWGSYRRW